jgi:hypothetical protein
VKWPSRSRARGVAALTPKGDVFAVTYRLKGREIEKLRTIFDATGRAAERRVASP